MKEYYLYLLWNEIPGWREKNESHYNNGKCVSGLKSTIILLKFCWYFCFVAVDFVTIRLSKMFETARKKRVKTQNMPFASKNGRTLAIEVVVNVRITQQTLR